MPGPPVARVTDTISHGGAITSGSPTVFVNLLAVARLGDSATCDIHGSVTITSASVISLANSIGIARVGDSLSCGATITSGSPNTFAG